MNAQKSPLAVGAAREAGIYPYESVNGAALSRASQARATSRIAIDDQASAHQECRRLGQSVALLFGRWISRRTLANSDPLLDALVKWRAHREAMVARNGGYSP